MGTVYEVLMGYFRRIILDAFWSRESSTVRSLHRELKMNIRLGGQIGLEVKDTFPDRGPFPVEDTVGIFQSVIMLKRTQKAGRRSYFVQFNTARNHRAEFSNYWHTTLQIMTTTMLSNETNKLTAT